MKEEYEKDTSKINIQETHRKAEMSYSNNVQLLYGPPEILNPEKYNRINSLNTTNGILAILIFLLGLISIVNKKVNKENKILIAIVTILAIAAITVVIQLMIQGLTNQ